MRSCYSTKFRFTPDGPLVPVNYYFADDAPWLPHACSFNANIWDSDLTRRPVGDQQRRYEEHGNDWYDGHPPPPGCCDAPFGTPEAWHYGGDGQPHKPSCPWYPVTETAIALVIRFVASVLSPRRYRGRIHLSLTFRSTVVSPRHYRGRIHLSLTFRSTVVSPRHYRGRIPLSLIPRSPSRPAPYYHGRIELALTPHSSYHKVGPYPGRIALSLRPSSPHWNAKLYRGRIGLALVPNSPHWQASLYHGRIALALVPNSASSNPVTGCGSYPIPRTLYLTCTGVNPSFGCGIYNGEHTLVFAGSCQWFDTTNNPQGNPIWVIQFANGVWAVNAYGQSTFENARATYDVSTWDGTFPITLNLDTVFSCSGWPSTITISNTP